MKVEAYRIQNNNKKQKETDKRKTAFRGPIDGAVTGTLAMLDTSPTANAVIIDLGSMVLPRTYVDSKRNKYAGAETFIREFSGTFVNCLSAGLFAVGISKLANKIIDKSSPINTSSWFTKDGIDTLREAWGQSENKTSKFVTNVLDNMSGMDGDKKVHFKDIEWNKIEWFDKDRWENIKWKDERFKGIHNKLKTKDGIVETLSTIIEDKTIDKKDSKNILEIVETRITNAFGVNKEVSVNIGKNRFDTSLTNLLRDTRDMGRDIFTNKNADIDKTFNKIAKVNKVKAFGALGLASVIALFSQHINRKITEKRTGRKGFVATNDFNKQNDAQTVLKPVYHKKDEFETDFYRRINKITEPVSFGSKQNKTEEDKKPENKTKLMAEKLIASAGIIGLALGVMKVKSAKDFARKLEFTGPVTTGNAIKTVYTSALVGRFMASDDSTELRETATRDYLGFLNWLVLGSFAAKGTANLLDKKREFLFNETNKDKVQDTPLKKIKHWLNNVQLKSHSEIASKGSDFAKKNMWKLNAAHAAGLAYSTIMLGFAVPVLNVIVTNHKLRKDKKKLNTNA